MKRTSLSFLLFIMMISASAQTRQLGHVREFNSGKSPLAGVQVTAYGAAATDTDGAGEFVLDFASYASGRAISSPDVYKRGYEVVNADALDGWILSTSRPMDIVMAKKGVIDDAKTKYYDIASENWSKKQSDAMVEINALYTQGAIDAQVRSEKLAALAARSEEYMAKLEEYSERFARINPDDLSELESKVLNLVNAGKIDEAVELYESSGIVSTAKSKLSELSAASEDAEKLVASMFRYADLCLLAGEKDADLKVLEIYQTVHEAFPDNFQYAFKYATQRQPLALDGMQPILDKCLSLAYDDKSLVLSLHMQAIQHNSKWEYSQASEVLLKALECLTADDVTMPSGDYIAVYMQTCRLLATAYTGMNLPDQAFDTYKDMTSEIENILKVEENVLLIDVLDDILVETYWEMARACVSDDKMFKKYAELAYGWALKSAGDDEEARLKAEISYLLSEQARYQHNADMAALRKVSFDMADKYGELYKLKPTSMNALMYAMHLDTKILTMLNEDVDSALPEIQKLEKMVKSNISSFSRLHAAMMRYFMEELYVIYYAFKADYNSRFEHVLKMQEPVAVLVELDVVASSRKIMTAYDYLLQMYVTQRKTQEALDLAYKLDAMYSSAVGDYVNTSLVSDVATAYIMAGKYDLALKYLEDVREYREQYIKDKPNDMEMKANLANTYNNLALCYSYVGNPHKAFKMQQKTVEYMTPFYLSNKVPYGQNYFTIVLNLSLYAYKAGENEVASSTIETLAELAEELKGLNPNYESFPLAASFVKGDFMVKTGDKKGSALVEKALKYESGTMTNDFVLMWLIQDYKEHGNAIFRMQ